MLKRPYLSNLLLTALPILFLLAALGTACAPVTPSLQSVPERIVPPLLATDTPSPLPPSPTPTPNYYFDFTDLIAELERSVPGPSSEGFLIPDDAGRHAFHTLALAMLYNDPAPALKIAADNGYELLSLFDVGEENAESFVLREVSPPDRGWGLYFMRKSNAQDIVIEAPHPVADVNTPAVALDLYRALDAQALFIAGAHRDANADGSSDPTHFADTIFQTMHTALFMPAGQPLHDTVFLQIHGYSQDEHPGYPQVVIGYNWQKDPIKEQVLDRIVSALSEQGISVGVCTGKRFQGLCGTTNVQRQSMPGGTFLHFELDWSLRQDAGRFVEALRQALNP